MSTKNPKISAYVPQIIYDRFVAFHKDKGKSMSESATIIFAEYFQIDLTKEEQPDTTSELPSKISDLEFQVAHLKTLYSNLVEKVEYLQSTQELLHKQFNEPKIETQKVEQDNSTSTLPVINSSQEFADKDSSEQPQVVSSQLELTYDSSKNENIFTQESDINTTLPAEKSQPELITASALSRILGKSNQYIKSLKHVKFKNDIEGFKRFLKTVDKTGVVWHFHEQKNRYYRD